MRQTRTMRASFAWPAPDVASLLARLFRRTTQATDSAQRPAAWAERTLTAAPRPPRTGHGLPVTANMAETAPAPRRPALTLVAETNALPAWASFSAAMPAPLSDLEVKALAMAAASATAENDSAATQAALTEALARLRALTIQSRH